MVAETHHIREECSYPAEMEVGAFTMLRTEPAVMAESGTAHEHTAQESSSRGIPPASRSGQRQRAEVTDVLDL